MKTIIKELNENNIDMKIIEEAANIIKDGNLVAFPTETVYGLGADGLNEEAISKIFWAKGRPQDNPLILHISSSEELEPLVKEIPKKAKICMEAFWPGPLTMIFKKSEIIPDAITAGLETVAIRMPDNEIARRLIKGSEKPIAAPSANTSGRPSPTKAKHVYNDLKGKLELILDGGGTGFGLESTVLDLTEEIPMILRPGGITLEDLRKVLGEVQVDQGIINESDGIIPKSPGQKYKHYAPKAKMFIFKGPNKDVVSRIKEEKKKYEKEGKKVGIMCTDENYNLYSGENIISMGEKGDKEKIAHQLFDILRKFDETDVQIILSEAVDDSEIGMAIMNRLMKAASGQIINL